MDYLKTNPAVTKATLINMKKKTFIKHALEISHLLLASEVGTNERYLYLNLQSKK